MTNATAIIIKDYLSTNPTERPMKEQNSQSADICPHCGVSLLESDVVARTYINKDSVDDENNCDEVIAYGHYKDGHFESDSFSGFSGGRYDLLDDSDTCTVCDGQL